MSKDRSVKIESLNMLLFSFSTNIIPTKQLQTFKFKAVDWHFVLVSISYISSLPAALIETLSEDRASVMQEKKQLEEELNRLRSTALVSSAFFTPNPSAQDVTEAGAAAAAARALPLVGACSSEPLAESDRLASVAAIRDDEHVDSAVEASMVTVQ